MLKVQFWWLLSKIQISRAGGFHQTKRSTNIGNSYCRISINLPNKSRFSQFWKKQSRYNGSCRRNKKRHIKITTKTDQLFVSFEIMQCIYGYTILYSHDEKPATPLVSMISLSERKIGVIFFVSFKLPDFFLYIYHTIVIVMMIMTTKLIFSHITPNLFQVRILG